MITVWRVWWSEQVLSSVGREEFQVIGHRNSDVPQHHTIIMTTRQLITDSPLSPIRPSIFRVAGLRSGVTIISPKCKCATVFSGVCECKRNWLRDSCRLSRPYQSPFNARPLWRQPRANYSTGRKTDTFCRKEVTKHVCSSV